MDAPARENPRLANDGGRAPVRYADRVRNQSNAANDPGQSTESPDSSRVDVARDAAASKPRPSRRRTWYRGKVGAGMAIGAGAAIFAIGVWIAFGLGFSRARPEFPLNRAIGLDSIPQITYQTGDTGWFRLEGEGWDPNFEQYGNVAEDSEARCILHWRTGHLGGGQIGTRIGATDFEASRFLLRSLSLNPNEATTLNLTATNNTRFELLFGIRNDDQISTGHAVRAFSASNHMIVFTIMCDRQGAVTPALMNDALLGVQLEISPV